METLIVVNDFTIGRNPCQPFNYMETLIQIRGPSEARTLFSGKELRHFHYSEVQSSFRPVSHPWPCSCDARLPSDGSRRPRFPAVLSTMQALRLPAPLPFGLLIRQPVPRLACLFAPDPPQAGAGPDPLFPPVVRVPASVRGQCRASQVPWRAIPWLCERSLTPVDPPAPRPWRRCRCCPR